MGRRALPLLAWQPPLGGVTSALQPRSRSGCHDFPGVWSGPVTGHPLSPALLVTFTDIREVSTHPRIILECIRGKFKKKNKCHESF